MPNPLFPILRLGHYVLSLLRRTYIQALQLTFMTQNAVKTNDEQSEKKKKLQKQFHLK